MCLVPSPLFFTKTHRQFEKEIVVLCARYSQQCIYRPLPFPVGQVFRPEKVAVNVDKSQSHEKETLCHIERSINKDGRRGIINHTTKLKDVNIETTSVRVPGATLRLT